MFLHLGLYLQVFSPHGKVNRNNADSLDYSRNYEVGERGEGMGSGPRLLSEAGACALGAGFSIVCSPRRPLPPCFSLVIHATLTFPSQSLSPPGFVGPAALLAHLSARAVVELPGFFAALVHTGSVGPAHFRPVSASLSPERRGGCECRLETGLGLLGPESDHGSGI